MDATEGAITIYAVVSVEYFWRVWYDKPVRPVDTEDPSYSSWSITNLTYTPPRGKRRTSLPTKEKLSSFSNTPAGSSANLSPALGSDRMTRDVRLMVIGLGLSTFFVYIRSIYRTIEVSSPVTYLGMS